MASLTRPRARLLPFRVRPAGFLVAALALAAISYYGVAASPAGNVPAAAGDIGASINLPAVGSIAQLDRAIRAWTANVDANDRDFLSATYLGLVYQQRGRLTSNLDDDTRALEAARRAIAIDATYGPARALEASVLFTLHDFGAARDRAEALVRDDPSQLGALATLADARLELGDIPGARAGFGQLAARTAGPAVDVRLARLAYVTGDATGAIRLARAARDAAVADDPKSAGFFHYALGEFARLGGDPVTARAAYSAALALRVDDLGALVGLARIDAFDGRDAAAIEALEHAARIAPAPDTLALLADLQARAGRRATADGTIATIRAIRQLSAVAGTVYDRQLTLFELDHDGATDAILAEARAALADRADAPGHDVVAWALHRLGRDDEAATESAAALATGTRDARILFHAGAIELARGRHDDGRAHLRAALDLGPALDPAERAEAEALISAP